MKKEIMVIKDVKFLGLENSIEYQWIKHLLDDNDKVFEKVNVRGSICLDKPQNLDAEEHLKKQMEGLIPALVFEQQKEIGRLNDVINAMSGEVRTHKKDKKQKDEIISILAVERTNLENDKLDLATKKMILETEKLNLKEENERLKNGKSN